MHCNSALDLWPLHPSLYLYTPHLPSSSSTLALNPNLTQPNHLFFQWSLSLRSSPVSNRASLLSELELSITDSGLHRGSVFDKIPEEAEEESEEEEDISFKTDIEVDDRTYRADSDSLVDGLREEVCGLGLLILYIMYISRKPLLE